MAKNPRTISEGPTLMDVLKEMKSETSKSLEMPREILKGTLEGACMGIGISHFLPTIIRYSKQQDSIIENEDPPIASTICRGVPRFATAFVTALGTAGIYYTQLKEKENLYFLAIPLLTNLLSITYESYRRNKEKLVERFPKFPGIT